MRILPARLEPDFNSRDLPLWMLYPVFFVAVYLTHLMLLRLPYFWDEAGYYIPAALDFFHKHLLVPESTLANAHPPLPSILLAGAWHITGFVISGTRTFVCMISAAALLAVFRISRIAAGTTTAIAVTLLTAIYPVWFSQSTLAHADIFATVFTLWGLSYYFETRLTEAPSCAKRLAAVAIFFTLAVLSKETAIVVPGALAAWELYELFRNPAQHADHAAQVAALGSPLLPLVAWFFYVRHKTGHFFGDPENFRYNATANFSVHRTLLAMMHRFLHLTVHMNMFVPTVCFIAALLMPRVRETRIPRRVLNAILVVLIASWLEYSILGGALLTRYLLPLYPLILLICVVEWRGHLQRWWPLAALTAAGFIAGIFINPPYGFAPEDNLTYRDMVVLHQQAINLIAQQYPGAVVFSAWPATRELENPDLGYVRQPFLTATLENFSFGQIEKAAANPGEYDTALVFSTQYLPPYKLNLGGYHSADDIKYFGLHNDLPPAAIAAILHGTVVWKAQRNGEWAAVIRFPRALDAQLLPPTQTASPQL